MLIALAAVLTACAHKQTFDATGLFEATEITVSSEAQGRILCLDIEEGDSVTAGQTVARIDSMQLYLTRIQLQNNARSVVVNRPDIPTQIASLREQIAKQQAERTRTTNLLKAGAATQKQLDDLDSAIRVLERELAAQLLLLEKSASSIDAQGSSIDFQIAQIDDRLAKCRIASPVSGTVLAKYAEAGELAATGTPLFKVADLGRVFLRSYVTSAQLAELKLGQRVGVTAQFGGDRQRQYDGTITWIASQSEFTPKNIQTVDDRADLVYAIKIGVENDGLIKIGGYGEVNF